MKLVLTAILAVLLMAGAAGCMSAEEKLNRQFVTVGEFNNHIGLESGYFDEAEARIAALEAENKALRATLDEWYTTLNGNVETYNAGLTELRAVVNHNADVMTQNADVLRQVVEYLERNP